jgi:hypothetical protein
MVWKPWSLKAGEEEGLEVKYGILVQHVKGYLFSGRRVMYVGAMGDLDTWMDCLWCEAQRP